MIRLQSNYHNKHEHCCIFISSTNVSQGLFLLASLCCPGQGTKIFRAETNYVKSTIVKEKQLS